MIRYLTGKLWTCQTEHNYINNVVGLEFPWLYIKFRGVLFLRFGEDIETVFTYMGMTDILVNRLELVEKIPYT